MFHICPTTTILMHRNAEVCLPSNDFCPGRLFADTCVDRFEPNLRASLCRVALLTLSPNCHDRDLEEVLCGGLFTIRCGGPCDSYIYSLLRRCNILLGGG